MKGKGGRKPEHPKPKVRDTIVLMVGSGLSHRDIAAVLKIGLDTLHDHYADALANGKAEVHKIVGGKILEACKEGHEWALKFYAARRMGWIEKTAVALGNDPENPLPQVDGSELARRIAFILQAAQPGADERAAGHGPNGHAGQAVDPKPRAAD